MKKKLMALVFAGVLFGSTGSLVAQTLMHDPVVNASVLSEFVASLTQLYEMYDHTMNQIEMIQQKYEQMQFYIDRAANWKWEDIQWDGDLDFRDEITQATKQVNKQLNNIRGIRNSLTSDTITFGNEDSSGRVMSYSLASLCGVSIDGQGNINDFVRDGTNYYSKGLAKAAAYWAEGVPEEEAQYIWAKYGLNPANYKMVREVEKKLKESTSVLVGNAEQSVEKTKIETEKAQALENTMDMLTQEGITPDEIASINAMLTKIEIDSLKDLRFQLEQTAGYLVWYNQLQEQKEESERQSKMERWEEMSKNSIPPDV